ncbi:MAG: hypothetical protein WCT20_05615 [Candidatus Babeliales bacterium]
MIKRFLMFLMVFGICLSWTSVAALQQQPENDSKPIYPMHRLKTNVIDAAIFTIAAKVINDYALKGGELSLQGSLGYGIGAWLLGELTEMVYKEVYKHFSEQSLRQELGESDFFSVQIDHQRLLRRLITGALLVLMLSLKS